MNKVAIYSLCNEYGGAEEDLEDLQNKLGKPLYIRVDTSQDNNIFASIEPFTLAEARKLQEEDSPRIKWIT